MARSFTKPVLGLVPTHIWEIAVKSERLEQINGAIERYVVAGKDVPKEWYDERNELMKFFEEDTKCQNK